MTRARTPTLLTPLGARGLAAVDQIERAGWKLGALQETAHGWKGTISREERSIAVFAVTADKCVEDLVVLLRQKGRLHA